VLFDVQTQQIISKLAECHEASVKCITEIQAHPDIVATGGREGRLAVHDLRCETPKVMAWRNTAQQILTKKGT